MSTPTRSTAASDFVIVGRVRKAHGIRGELVVEPITDTPDTVFAPGRRVFAGTVDGDPAPAAERRELHVERASRFKDGLIVLFREIGDRSTAEQWRSRFFLLPRVETAPLADGEIYVHELLAMRVRLESGETLGDVIDLFELPHGLALDVRRADGRGTIMLLYEQSVLSIDREARVLTVRVPEGMLE